MRSALLLLVLLPSACGVDVAMDRDVTLTCEASSACPEGFFCEPSLEVCLARGSSPPRQHPTFFLPKDGAANVSTAGQLIVAFALPVSLASAEARVHLFDGSGAEVQLEPLEAPEPNTLLITTAAELGSLETYALTLDAGIAAAAGELALPTDQAVTTHFTTAERPDRTPPGPVSGIFVDHLSASRADLTWTLPADSDVAGVLVLRKAGALVELDPAAAAPELPMGGVSYAVGARLGDAEVAGVVSGDHMSSVDLVAGFYDWVFFTMDRAGNYAAPRRAPLVSSTQLGWCPSEQGSFRVVSPDAGTQSLSLSLASGGAATRVGASSMGADTPFAAPDVTVGETYALRFCAAGTDGEYCSVPQAFTASRASLTPLVQPVPPGRRLGLGGIAVLGFAPYAWPGFEAEVDVGPAPDPDLDWQPLVLTSTSEARAVMSSAGSFRVRVRPVVAGCAPAPWVTSDEFQVGSGARYVSAALGNDANNGASPLTAYATLEKALADADGSDAMDIYVAEGTYTPVPPARPAGCDRCASAADSPSGLVVKSKVRIFGGYSADFLTRDPPPLDDDEQLVTLAHETILHGDLNAEDYEVAEFGFDSETCRAAVTFMPAAQGIQLDQLTVQPTSGTGGSRCGVFIGRWVGVSITNSKIHSVPVGNNGYPDAIQMRCGRNVTLSGNLIQPNGDHGKERGVYATCWIRESDTTLSNNLIRAGHGLFLSAANLSASLKEQQRFFVDGNRIHSGNTSTDTDPVGVECVDHADLRLTNNIIRPDHTTVDNRGSIAVRTAANCQGVVTGNLIDGGAGNLANTTGLDVAGPVLNGHSLVVSNNLISGGLGRLSRRAVRFNGAVPDATHGGEVLFVHNHVAVFAFGNTLSNDNATLFDPWFSGAWNGRVVNNVFFGRWDKTGLLFGGGKLDAFQHNLLVTSAGLKLFNDNGTPYYDLVGFEAQMCSGANYAKYQNPTKQNAATALPLDQLFVSPGGPDGLPETLEDNDWRPLAAAASVFAVGVDTTQAVCGGPGGTANACTQAATRACGNVTTDRAGATRPTIPAAGAYEP